MGAHHYSLYVYVCLKVLISPDWRGSVGWVLLEKRKVSSWIPYQPAHLGCGPVPGQGVRKSMWRPVSVSLTHWCFSPSLPSLLSKNKYNLLKSSHNKKLNQ